MPLSESQFGPILRIGSDRAGCDPLLDAEQVRAIMQKFQAQGPAAQ